MILSLPSLAAPAPADREDDPLCSESPAVSAQGRFAVGLGGVHEHQTGISIAAQQTTTRLSSPNGSSSSVTVPGDPALLNRKVDPEWRLWGPQVRVAIPLSGAARRWRSALVLDVAQAAVTLDVDDRTAAGGTSRSGRGVVVGATLDLHAPLCATCPWYAGASLGYATTPSLDLDRSTPFAAPGMTVQGEEASLSLHSSDAALRLGYAPASWRIAPFAGARYTASELEATDSLRLLSTATGLATTVDSRTRFEGRGARAVAGVDARLGRRLFGRVEVSYGEGDRGIGVQLSHAPRFGRGVPCSPDDAARRARERRERQRATEIALRIAPQLASLRERFLAAWAALPQSEENGVVVYPRAEVEKLLIGLEADILAVLAEPELAPMRDYVITDLRRARQQLDAAPGAGSPAGSARVGTTGAVRPAAWSRADTRTVTRASFAVLRYDRRLLATARPATVGKAAADRARDESVATLDVVHARAANDDTVIDLCVASTPVQRAELRMHPPMFPDYKEVTNTNQRMANVYRGRFVYSVTRYGYKTIANRELDLMKTTPTMLVCELVEQSKPEPALQCDPFYGAIEECRPQ